MKHRLSTPPFREHAGVRTRPLAARMAALEESQTIAFTTRARELRAAGHDIISMTAGEPDLPTAAHIRAAAIEAIESGFTRYTAVGGIPELLDAIRMKFARDNGLTFSAGEVAATTGAKQALANTLMVLCEEGDEVLIPSPYWVSYPPLVRLTGAEPVMVHAGAARGFRPDIAGLRAAVTARTKAILVNTPCNPTGIVYRRDELEAIAALAREHDLYIISDEVYEGVLFDGRPHVSIGTLADAAGRTITVSGVSKTYAMTGWRLGFLGGPADIVQATIRVQSQTTSNANSIAQKAAIAALTGPQESVHDMARDFQQRRDAALKAFRQVPELQIVEPEGAMFLFIGVERLLGRTGAGAALTTAVDVVEHLLNSQQVVLVPGGAFGDATCVRLSFACPIQEVREGLRRIVRAVEELRPRAAGQPM